MHRRRLAFSCTSESFEQNTCLCFVFIHIMTWVCDCMKVCQHVSVACCLWDSFLIRFCLIKSAKKVIYLRKCPFICRDSLVCIATRHVLGGPGIESRWGARFSAPIHTGIGAHPVSCTVSTGSFLRVKRPGRGVYHQTPSSAEVKEKVELWLSSRSGPSWPVQGWTLPLLYLYSPFIWLSWNNDPAFIHLK
jgi:hypothetical protein